MYTNTFLFSSDALDHFIWCLFLSFGLKYNSQGCIGYHKYRSLRKILTDKAKDFIGKGHPGGEQQGKRSPENCPCRVACRLRVSFPSCLWPVILLCPYLVWLRVLPGGTLRSSAKMDSSMKVSGRLEDILWTGISFLLSALPKFFQLVFSSSTIFLIGISCYETTHAGSYYYAKVGGFGQWFPNILISEYKAQQGRKYFNVKW